jgi:triacylglycerol lipase
MRALPTLLALPFAVIASVAFPVVQEMFLPSPGVVRELVQKSRAKPPAAPVVHRDIVYASRLFGDQRLDIYEPTVAYREGQAPVVVFLHGGSWIRGDKITIRVVDRFLSRMRDAGYFVLAVNYTTSVLQGFEGPLDNTGAALRWIAEHEETYGYDASNVGLYGVSAGGHLALMAASGPLPPGIELSFLFIECAPTDLVALREGEAFDSSGMFRLFRRRQLAEMSPIEYVSPDLPPMLIYHGERDRTVHIRQSERYVEAVREAGGSATLVRYPEGDHAFLNMTDEQWYEQETLALRFFDQHSRRARARES